MSQSPHPKRPDTDTTKDDSEEEENDGPAFLQGDPFKPPAGRRWTSKVEILVIEAELLQDGLVVENPAMPINRHVKERALNRIGGGVAPWREIEKFPRSDS